jgi:hypothetical protein
LWSRREGFNRAIIEAMFADVPVILRDGFNYGYRYPYINALTGRYATEENLADAILDVLDDGKRFSPRAWVMEHMTCQHATRILNERLNAESARQGEPWSDDMVVKTAGLHTQQYWNPAEKDLFAEDYRFLEDSLR